MDFFGAVAASEMSQTANGARTHKATGSAVLDLFSRLPSMRSASEGDLTFLFDKAFAEDPLLAMKTLFYTRDVRKGQGERRVFRSLWEHLMECGDKRDAALKNMSNVPVFGRWDDLFVDLSEDTLAYIKANLTLDSMDGEKPSFMNLLYKWLPSENTSSKETRAKAKTIREYLKLTPRAYRKMLTDGRKKALIVESLMSAGKWEDINYSHIPSQASRIYRKAFGKHDTDRYGEFIKKALAGEVKINAAVTYPYEIVREYFSKGGAYGGVSDLDGTLEAIWKQLPDYVAGDHNAIVVADTSGSMHSPECLPISVCISLAIYFAERNRSKVFGGKFITFSVQPELQSVAGSNLLAKISNLSRAHWDGNTDLIAVFKLILDAAVKHGLSQDDLPKKIFIISDMQFDCVSGSNKRTNYEKIMKMYSDAGYTAPTLVFWNVGSASSTQTSPVTMNENGVYLVAGCSPTIFKNALNTKATTPYEMMLETLNDERYASISV